MSVSNIRERHRIASHQFQSIDFKGKGEIRQRVFNDKSLTRAQAQIMSFLIDQARAATDKCWPSLAEITNATELSKSTVCENLIKLEKRGRFRSIQTTKGGRNHRTVYEGVLTWALERYGLDDKLSGPRADTLEKETVRSKGGHASTIKKPVVAIKKVRSKEEAGTRPLRGQGVPAFSFHSEGQDEQVGSGIAEQEASQDLAPVQPKAGAGLVTKRREPDHDDDPDAIYVDPDERQCADERWAMEDIEFSKNVPDGVTPAEFEKREEWEMWQPGYGRLKAEFTISQTALEREHDRFMTRVVLKNGTVEPFPGDREANRRFRGWVKNKLAGFPKAKLVW